ncbi:hypothetical protein MELA_02696 [Candidatus Methylomirabilis lanthanidiphila]|uniref:Uncharacterized protein n=1 Tax=Candidatus Methylomirabilis lanthanidiphila TaxID=2211376 RepID=A0A564ZLU4_9BACT|nr:hypothetical protein MELA_02696 [Candidatus Methylomirabilis lanthanidiphila]
MTEPTIICYTKHLSSVRKDYRIQASFKKDW